MLIIIEGPDGSGKTALAAALSELTGLRVHHHGPYKGISDVAEFYWKSVDEATFGPGIIMDRSWISEPVYGGVVRNGRVRVSVNERRALERAALGAGGVTVICSAGFEFCEANWKSRRAGEYVKSAEQNRRIWAAYNSLEERLPTVFYDAEKDGRRYAGVLDSIMSARIENRGPGTGCFAKGNVLVVMSGSTPLATGKPPVPADFATVLVPERELYWIEAGADPAFLEELKPRHAVAIGRKAEDWLASAGIFDFESTERPEGVPGLLGYVPGR